jgi:drug/metabolite transporter (DMT)-like permease
LPARAISGADAEKRCPSYRLLQVASRFDDFNLIELVLSGIASINSYLRRNPPGVIDSRSRWLPISGLLLAMMLWASSYVALKLAFRTYDPMVVIFGRMALAALSFACFFRAFRSFHYHRGDWKPILFMTVCEPCLYFLFEAKALENTTASQAGMITALLPLVVAVNARFFLRERLGARTVLGFAVAIAGAVWLSVGGAPSQQAPNPPLGNLLEFVAILCATGYIITLKRLTRRYSPFVLTAFQALVGTLFYLPILFLPSTDLPVQFDAVGSLAVVYLGICVTLGAYGLYNFAVSRLPVSQASAFVNLIPVFTLMMAWLILDETLTATQCLATVLIFCGIWLSQEYASSAAGNGRNKPSVEMLHRTCAVRRK